MTTLPAASISATTTPSFSGTVRLGRLCIQTSLSSARWRDVLLVLFKQCWLGQALTQRIDGQLSVDALEDDDVRPAVPRDGVRIETDGGRLRIDTDVVAATLVTSTAPWTLALGVHPEAPDDLLQIHLSIVMHRVLLALDAVYLHAAAVTIDGGTHLFIGEKGAGKSTVSLALARAGGTLLSDDHVLLERRGGLFEVSGCERVARIAADAEAHLFPVPLPVPAADFAGVLKKEFVAGDHLPARPYEPATLSALYFPRVGRALSLTPRAAQPALVDLLHRTRRSFRPQDPGDVAAILDFWSALVESVPAFDLELAPDLRTLDRLPSLLVV